MKKILIICATLIALVAMIACTDKDSSNYKELIVGKWELTSYHNWFHNCTDEMGSYDIIYNLPDTNYLGYDSVEFTSDGTTQWHMNNLYLQGSLDSDPYKNFTWHISNDSLFVYPAQWKFEIKELDTKALVIEQYFNNQHPLRPQEPRWEQRICYTFKRVK